MIANDVPPRLRPDTHLSRQTPRIGRDAGHDRRPYRCIFWVSGRSGEWPESALDDIEGDVAETTIVVPCVVAEVSECVVHVEMLSFR